VGHLDRVYANRFADPDAAAKDRVWVEIGKYLQRYVDADAPVLDLACDRGYFIRNIAATERWATDMRDVAAALPADIRFVQSSGLELAEVLPKAHFGTIFMSNYLEHLESGDQVTDQLRVAAGLLRPGGHVVILQPNIRLVGAAYWDFIDHKVALTEYSLAEAAEAAGFETWQVVVRFLPYTTKSRVPKSALLVRAYLKFRPMWRLMGGQTLYVGRKP
jgi:SAM-dependent methyltransferase